MIRWGRRGVRALFLRGVSPDRATIPTPQFTFPLTVEFVISADNYMQGYTGIIDYGRDVKKNFWILTGAPATGHRIIIGTGDGEYFKEVWINITSEHLGKFIVVHALFENSRMKAYLNGAIAGELTLTITPVIDLTLDMRIGCRVPLYLYTRMIIPLVRIYNRILTDSEIAKNYVHARKLEASTIRDGLVLELLPSTLDCDNLIWHDNSGNGNDANIEGGRCVEI